MASDWSGEPTDKEPEKIPIITWREWLAIGLVIVGAAVWLGWCLK